MNIHPLLQVLNLQGSPSFWVKYRVASKVNWSTPTCLLAMPPRPGTTFPPKHSFISHEQENQRLLCLSKDANGPLSVLINKTTSLLSLFLMKTLFWWVFKKLFPGILYYITKTFLRVLLSKKTCTGKNLQTKQLFIFESKFKKCFSFYYTWR